MLRWMKTSKKTVIPTLSRPKSRSSVVFRNFKNHGNDGNSRGHSKVNSAFNIWIPLIWTKPVIVRNDHKKTSQAFFIFDWLFPLRCIVLALLFCLLLGRNSDPRSQSRLSHPLSNYGSCLNFRREKTSNIFFSRRLPSDYNLPALLGALSS